MKNMSDVEKGILWRIFRLGVPNEISKLIGSLFQEDACYFTEKVVKTIEQSGYDGKKTIGLQGYRAQRGGVLSIYIGDERVVTLGYNEDDWSVFMETQTMLENEFKKRQWPYKEI